MVGLLYGSNIMSKTTFCFVLDHLLKIICHKMTHHIDWSAWQSMWFIQVWYIKSMFNVKKEITQHSWTTHGERQF